MLEYEPHLARAYARLIAPGDTVFDVGANEGQHLAQFAELVGSSGCVVAFEPIPALAAGLIDRYADDRRISIQQVALGAKRGQSAFQHVINDPGYSGLRQRVYARPDPSVEQIAVSVDTLDSYAGFFHRVSFVKIDIEGGEVDCLRGGLEFIARHRPAISVEYGEPAYSGYGHTAMTLYELAEMIGYVIHEVDGNPLDSPEKWLAVCNHRGWDFLLLPSEPLAPRPAPKDA